MTALPHRISVYDQYERLGAAKQKLVLDFVRALATTKIARQRGVPGKNLISYAGDIDPADLESMSKLIALDCGQVSLSEW